LKLLLAINANEKKGDNGMKIVMPDASNLIYGRRGWQCVQYIPIKRRYIEVLRFGGHPSSFYLITFLIMLQKLPIESGLSFLPLCIIHHEV